MNREKSSYQYEKEEGDVDERSIEDFKDCFVEIFQHEMLEAKASAETREPYVFNTNDMCLTTGCTNGGNG